MAGNGIQFLFVLFVSVLALVKVSSARGAAQKCAWNTYFDDNMNDCGPCSEICTGVVHPNVSRGTEEQCRKECSEYLASLKCTKDEYYDDIVHACAPCSEICNHHEITKTTRDCSSQCKKYLPTMAKRCTNKQYFAQEAMKCEECSDLCSINNEVNVTNLDCFEKCNSYLEQYYPRILEEHLRLPGKPTAPTANSSPSNLHPGTITSIAIGVVFAVFAALSFAVFWFHLRPQKYTRTPNNDDEAGLNADESVEAVLNESQARPQDSSFGMKDLGTSIQVSSEVIPQQTTTEEKTHNVDELGMPEMDLFAPSSAASGLVKNRES